MPSAEIASCKPPRKHQTVHPRTPTETVAWAFPPKYTLTRICSVEYTKSMESVFEIIAEPNRRAILSLLVSSQQAVGEIERQLGMPQHAQVLGHNRLRHAKLPLDLSHRLL